MKRWGPLILLAVPALSGCVAGSGGGANPNAGRPVADLPARPTTPPPTQPTPMRDGFITPRIMNLPGLEGVIGESISGVQRQFGEPALDVFEGDVRKLQYRSASCVLDIYFYPLRPGAQPGATHVEARRSSDALDVDRAACVAASRR
ncbi:MAG: hypothetical protein WA948_11650 [Pontixanthobacter sp.]